jgi:cysteine desulfurase / selenocysteine lyase
MRNYKQDFPDSSPTIYLDCAYQGPFPRVTSARLREAIELKCHPERLKAPDYFDLPERVRARLSRLVGAERDEVAITNSVTQGIGIVATGLEWAAGDEVVIASSNFPSNLFTWLHLQRRGVRVTLIQPRQGCVQADDVGAVLTSRTRVVALDWVSYATGARIDLAALGDLAHRRGALFVVDGTQGVGAIELDLHALPVDVLVGAAYKWLLGPYGTGFAYIQKDLQDRLDLPVVNWSSVEGSDQFDALPVDQFTLPRAARVFDVGETANFINLHGLDPSLEYVENAGVSTVNRHCRRLLDRLAEGLAGYPLSAAAEAEHASTILGFQARSPAATKELHASLRARHVAVSLRHGMIRVSPHLYNGDDDIDRLLAGVRESS